MAGRDRGGERRRDDARAPGRAREGGGARRGDLADRIAALHQSLIPGRPARERAPDGFKGYNDAFGHLAGDALLTRLGAKLSTAVAGHGAAYRLGGDEFCVLIDAGVPGVQTVISRAGAALEERGETFRIGASCGLVTLPREASTTDYALQLADERMYASKPGLSSRSGDHTRDVLMQTMQAKQPGLDLHSGHVGELAILDKPELLDAAEWEFIRQHTILGERILSAAPAYRPVAVIVRSSHERWDGGGYPDGLAGDEIPLGARIVALCDAYEAMTSDRSYRAGITHEYDAPRCGGSSWRAW